jgi:hypothetical protein
VASVPVALEALWQADPAARVLMTAVDKAAGLKHPCVLSDDDLVRVYAVCDTVAKESGEPENNRPPGWSRVVRSRDACSKLLATSLVYLR